MFTYDKENYEYFCCTKNICKSASCICRKDNCLVYSCLPCALIYDILEFIPNLCCNIINNI